MPLLKHLAWGYIIFLAAPAFAQATSQIELRNLCSDAVFSQADIKICIETALSNSEKSLAEAEKKLSLALNAWDETSHHIRQAHIELIASQKAFSLYRQQQCKLLRSASGGAAGNTQTIRHAACTAELNQRRAAQLLEVISELPSKDKSP